VLLAGFPHDSLTHSVEKNADDLLAKLRNLGLPPTILVGHSRGGLVARAAAVKNAKAQSGDKIEIRAMVTFGTPHNGAALAELPGGAIFVSLLGQAAGQSARVASIGDVLSCYLADESFPGVSDLKPVRTKKEYLDTLQSAEGNLAHNERIPIKRIGGTAKPSGAIAWLWKRVTGSDENDLVVELKSSLPYGARNGDQMIKGCDHFSYFKDYSRIEEAQQFILTMAE
jgi:pimeloyl-ACP methyl ester carboxylesterase